MDEHTKWLKDSIDKIDNKLERLDQRVDSIDLTLVKNTESLIQHEQRTTLNEENLELLRKDFIPIKQHVDFVNFVAKLLVGLGTLAAFLHEMGLF